MDLFFLASLQKDVAVNSGGKKKTWVSTGLN
jgi:hypothetical protein